jgi:peptidoglycan/xylan/chitin deacetylase (PgdA/CDA1 family)
LFIRRRAFGGRQVRVLTYHRVRNAVRDPFSVTVEEFDRQMAWLRARQTVVSLEDLLSFLRDRRELPKDAVLVTIDDGYEDVCTHALPVLVKHRIPAVAFITAGEMSSGDGTPDRKLSRADVAVLHQHGVDVGSHAWEHRSMARMAREDATFEAEVSRAALAQLTGRPLRAFAYPFGTRLDFNASTGAVLRAAGYECAFTSQHGPVTHASDPMELRRIKIEGGDPFWVFRIAVRGGLDAWSLIDRLGARLQSSERRPVRNARATQPTRRSAAVNVSGRPIT